MVLRVVPNKDDRNDVRKDLDEAVKAVHVNLGNDALGFVLVAWPEDKHHPITCYTCGQIDPDYLPEYVKQKILDVQLDDIIGVDLEE